MPTGKKIEAGHGARRGEDKGWAGGGAGRRGVESTSMIRQGLLQRLGCLQGFGGGCGAGSTSTIWVFSEVLGDVEENRIYLNELNLLHLLNWDGTLLDVLGGDGLGVVLLLCRDWRESLLYDLAKR